MVAAPFERSSRIHRENAVRIPEELKLLQRNRGYDARFAELFARRTWISDGGKNDGGTAGR